MLTSTLTPVILKFVCIVLQTAFEYSSPFWTNKATWNVEAGLDGLAQNETKLASYHNTPFTNVCLGMTRNSVTNWILVHYTAASLYSVIAGENSHDTNAGRGEWLSLIKGPKLQPYCNKEGFNVNVSNNNHKLRIGIAGNNENDCNSCDSLIGFGIERKTRTYGIVKWSSGNIYLYPDRSLIRTFGYIFVQ